MIYTLENGATVVVRPSGTEPKIKTYFTTLGKTLEEAQAQKDALAAAIETILKRAPEKRSVFAPLPCRRGAFLLYKIGCSLPGDTV